MADKNIISQLQKNWKKAQEKIRELEAVNKNQSIVETHKLEIDLGNDKKFIGVKEEVKDLKQTVEDSSDKVVKAIQGIKFPEVKIPSSNFGLDRINNFISSFKSISFKGVVEVLNKISEKIDSLKIKLPKTAEDAISVRLSNGEKFYEAITQVFNSGGGGSVPTVGTSQSGIRGVPVVNPDGSNISAGGSGTAAYSDSGGTDKKGLVDGDRHVQTDVLTVPSDPFGANADAASATGSISAKLRRLATDLAAVVSGAEIQADIVGPLPPGTNTIGGFNLIPATSGGLSTMNASSSDGGTALTSTAQVIKASAGQLFGYYIYNPNSSAQFVQFYNTAAASVTVGTTNPLFMLTIPATSAANLMGETGITFSNAGWSWAATSTAGGAGAPTTALDAVAWYK